jgi:hypothetical protein
MAGRGAQNGGELTSRRRAGREIQLAADLLLAGRCFVDERDAG